MCHYKRQGPTYPGQFSMPSRVVFVERSIHWKIFGTDGGVEPSLAPMEMAVIPARESNGTSARVMPGTSRCESVVFFGSPNLASIDHVSASPASIRLGSIISSSALWGNACLGNNTHKHTNTQTHKHTHTRSTRRVVNTEGRSEYVVGLVSPRDWIVHFLGESVRR